MVKMVVAYDGTDFSGFAAQHGQPAERRVPVRGGVVRGRRERVDHVLRRPHLGIPAAEVDERLPLQRGVLGDDRQQRREILLREPFERVRAGSHRAIVGCPVATWPTGCDNPPAKELNRWKTVQSKRPGQ